jgi:hypothetical protein
MPVIRHDEIGILVCSGLFLAEDYSIHQILTKRARARVRVRFLPGDPDLATGRRTRSR